MTTGYSIHIGLNEVNPKDYEGWVGRLAACEFDAKDMAAIARHRNFQTATTLLTPQATRDAVKSALSDAAGKLRSGDVLFLTYSGHGGTLPDLNSDEDDMQDETWCLYDGELVDDELFSYLGKFEAGVRIFMLSDSCHSGTVAKAQLLSTPPPSGAPARTYRALPNDVAGRVYHANRGFYDEILKDPKVADSKDKVKASVLLISGCQDNQLSSDGPFNGLFTANFLAVWNGGKFKGNYRTLHKRILARMPFDQSPNFYRTGALNAAFEKQRALIV